VSEAVIPDAIERYRQTLTEMAEIAGEQGHTSSTRRWDRLVDRLRPDEETLRESPEGRAAISALMADSRPAVRLWSATAALGWDEQTARAVLVELREQPSAYGLHSINAKHTLLGHDGATG
jgi:hypothetical protein